MLQRTDPADGRRKRAVYAASGPAVSFELLIWNAATRERGYV
jgi:hypothetical protein